MSDGVNPGPIAAELLHGAFPAVRVADAADPPLDDAQKQAWAGLCELNPRLHDGPIWSVVDASAAQITVRKTRYSRLALQRHDGAGDLGVRQLGVKGVTVAVRGGEPHILIARRGRRVRTYAGMWETAPAGGVDARAEPTEPAVAQTLIAEAREELGVDASSSLPGVRFAALLHDSAAQSVELVAILPWPGPLDDHWRLPDHREQAWEYSAAQWLRLSAIPEFIASSNEIAPPARWILANTHAIIA